MSSWLLDSLRSAISPSLVTNAARHLDERQAAVRDGLVTTLSTIVAALALRADDADTMRRVVSLFPGPNIDEHTVVALGMRELGDPASAPAHDAGEALLSLLFAGRRDAIAASIARRAKLRSESAWAILDVSAPLVLAGLGARMHAGTSPLALSAMLQANHRELVGAAVSEVSHLTAAGIAAGAGVTRRTTIGRLASRLGRRWRQHPPDAVSGGEALSGVTSTQ